MPQYRYAKLNVDWSVLYYSYHNPSSIIFICLQTIYAFILINQPTEATCSSYLKNNEAVNEVYDFKNWLIS